MQKKLSETQKEMAHKTFEASAGGDMVTAVVNGKLEVQKIKISKEVIDPEDPEMLEDLVLSALNSALGKAQEAAQSNLGNLTGGIDPGTLFNS